MRSVLRFLLTVLAGVLYGIGWGVGKVAVLVSWVWSAAAVGWDDAHSAPTPVDAPLRQVA